MSYDPSTYCKIISGADILCTGTSNGYYSRAYLSVVQATSDTIRISCSGNTSFSYGCMVAMPVYD